MATAVLVFTLLFSTLAMLPWNTAEGAGSTYTISFNVTDSDYNPVENAKATLEEVHTGSTYTEYTDSSGLVTFSPGPGYFKLTITKSGYYDVEYPSVIRFDGLKSVNLGILMMEMIPAMDHWLNISVQKAGTTEPVENVTMKVIDVDNDFLLYDVTAGGNFNISVYQDEFKLLFTAPGFAQEVTTYTVTGNDSLTIEMNESKVVRGFVYIDNSPVTSGLTAYLISTETGADLDYRIIYPRSLGTNTFIFDAYPGDFYLLVDADGCRANVSMLTVSNSMILTVNLLDQTTQYDNWQFEFGDEGWSSFNLTRTARYDYDRGHPAIDFSFLPNIRMQIDLALGNGDGEVNETEAEIFRNRLSEFGPKYVTTHDLFRINSTSFVSDESGFSSITVENITGPVNSTGSFEITSVTAYEAIGSIESGADVYTGILTVTTGVEDTGDAAVERKYTITTPAGYELVENETEVTGIDVSGYLVIEVIPETSLPWGTADVSLVFESSVAPTAVASLITDAHAYEVMNETQLLYYIVGEGYPVNFTASGSYDPNGNPLQYHWEFGDGESETVSTPVTEHVYSAKAYQLEVVLTVIDVAGLTDQATFTVRVDGVNPTAVIKVDGEQVTPGSTVDASQNKALIFDGSESYDIINSTSDPEHGVIASWHWDFGDGNSTTVVKGEEVTHSYEEAGNYTVTLNLTDAVGHVTTTSFYVNVRDTTPPEVNFDVMNSGFQPIDEESPMENETLYFDASKTRDNRDPVDELTFFWEFGDGDNATGINVSHSYRSIGTFTCKLTVTDTSGNSANRTMQITVVSSPRPDLRITSINLAPVTFTEGEKGTILVNITNVGNSDATGITGTFYRMTASGDKVLLGTSSDLTRNGQPVGVIAPDDYAILAFGWTPGSKGNYTIYVEVKADREINTHDNHSTVSIDVNEASWKAAALYGGIFAAIVIIIVLLYFRKRLPLGATKAPARTRRGKK